MQIATILILLIAAGIYCWDPQWKVRLKKVALGGLILVAAYFLLPLMWDAMPERLRRTDIGISSLIGDPDSESDRTYAAKANDEIDRLNKAEKAEVRDLSDPTAIRNVKAKYAAEREKWLDVKNAKGAQLKPKGSYENPKRITYDEGHYVNEQLAASLKNGQCTDWHDTPKTHGAYYINAYWTPVSGLKYGFDLEIEGRGVIKISEGAPFPNDIQGKRFRVIARADLTDVTYKHVPL